MLLSRCRAQPRDAGQESGFDAARPPIVKRLSHEGLHVEVADGGVCRVPFVAQRRAESGTASEVWLDRTPQRRPRTAAVRIVFGLGYC